MTYKTSWLLLAGIIVSAAFWSESAVAKPELRIPSTTWRLYGGDAADFDSASEAFSAFNTASSQAFDTCMARNCGGCSKVNYTGEKLGFVKVIINGEFASKMTTGGTGTSAAPSCTVDYGNGNVVTYPATPPTTQSVGGAAIAAVSILRCPTGWGITVNRNLGTIIVDGDPVTTYEQLCGSEIPEPCKSSCTKFGNPIDAVSADKSQADLDYVSADGLLSVERTYSSVNNRWRWNHETLLADYTGRNASRPPYADMVAYILAYPPGMYYYFNLPLPPPVPRAKSYVLVADDRTNPTTEVSVIASDGRTVFKEGPASVFTTTALSKPGLTVAGSGAGLLWTLRLPDRGFQQFDNSGSLTKSVRPDGKYLTFARDASGVVVTAWPGGRSVVHTTVLIPPPGKPIHVATLPDGSTLTYDSDAAGLVTRATYADGSSRTYVYNEPTLIGSASIATNWITGLVDELGVRTGTYAYDGVNPKSTELAGGVGKYTFSFSASSTSVTTPLSSTIGLVWSVGPDGERRLTSRSQPSGSGYTASSKTLSYDAAGNVASVDDFNGNRTCFVSDTTRNLETTRVEGLASVGCSSYTSPNASLPTGSRKTSTTWHPDWRLESARAEANKLTTWAYNGQPDPFNGGATASCAPVAALLPDGKPIAVLCKQVEQATTDTDGHLGFTAALQSGVANRAQQWTYNQYGQVLTAKGPRTDVNDTTTYAYYATTTANYTAGDLSSVTNAALQTTQYQTYNKHGQVLRSVDPNGVITDNVYDLRQRLTRTTVGGQQTSYSYDLAGQLKQLALPDTTTITYSYDPAHRLTKVTDQAGNSVTYTLDSAGNHLMDEVKDPGGNLGRAVTRAFDALGRVQQVTGASR